MGRLKIIGLWLLQIALAIVMIGPGLQKFTGPTWERMFRAWGYPDHFYLVIGAIEVGAGLGLLVPRLASPSALLLAVVMCGAAVTHRMQGDRSGIGELVFASLLLLIAWARWRDARLPSLNRSARPAAPREHLGT